MKLIINIPAFNEAEDIGKTIRAIPREFLGFSEVLIQVVDDGSTDDTAKVATDAGADIVVSHDRNRRLGETFNTAVDSALEHGADVMVNFDADGQFDADEIKDLLAPILSGEADMTVGDRFSQNSAKNIPAVKNFINRLGAGMVGYFLNVKINDLTCGFRAHNREALLRLNRVTGFTYTQETIIDAIGKNLAIQWVPISIEYFDDRQSRIVKSVWRFVNDSAKIIVKAVRDVRPMKFFGIPGFAILFLSVAFFVAFLALYLPEFQFTPFRNYLFVAIVLFLVGMQFTIFALIADMIRGARKLSEEALYHERKRRYAKKD